MTYSATVAPGHTAPRRVRRILVPVDFSAASTAAVEHASALAAAEGAGVELLHVWEVPPYTAAAKVGDSGETLVDYVQKQAAKRLEETVLSAQQGHAAKVSGRLESGDPVTVILREARDVDLVVMGAHGGAALSEILFGSVADRVIADAPCPVITLRPTGEIDDVVRGSR